MRHSLHIGVSVVSGFWYGTRYSKLLAPCIDAGELARVAAGRGYSAVTLVDVDATTDRVVDELGRAARSLKEGDTFLLTYNGHGTGGRSRAGFQQSWCLYNRPLWRGGDDGLDAALARFARGVRIIVIAGCCHAGGEDVGRTNIRAEIVRIAACSGTRPSPDANRQGVPSPFIREILDAARTSGTMEQFFARLRPFNAEIVPQLEISPNCSRAFLDAGPFGAMSGAANQIAG
ncbi:MAG TPA: hypothetical protein VFN10_00530 [Thermoanaerobaculia bacterium]|nr:hypothetical protein [Thermoanaerobaculia bacterium]